ncbi:hypothetical protein BACCAP_00809 [Pseudoflavonifractor capillosus ATCC 29799]|uniref:Uncharacterized protein n=1 Tax=Pseudoflavonifractor capillosus ATCC 29799 TaxID=411467 RepID=A6NRI1_9FIRM|nr:hypothetical protein BACCAP_00809 [Pseudoflavonifractor capillosus ATCC 29799]
MRLTKEVKRKNMHRKQKMCYYNVCLPQQLNFLEQLPRNNRTAKI